jgi:RNA polymerase sigma-70 factor (ECF subfamily)
MAWHRRDRALARRLLRGDEEAFRSFFDDTFPVIYRFCLRRAGGDDTLAEEAAQQALCVAVRRLSTYRGEAALLTWCTTIARHELSRLAARAGRAREEPLDALGPELAAAIDSLAALEPDDGGATARLRRQDLRTLVRRTLDGLPPRYRRALEWKYLDDQPVVRIAERLGVGPKAAESLLTRARGAFREAFPLVCRAAGETGDGRTAP